MSKLRSSHRGNQIRGEFVGRDGSIPAADIRAYVDSQYLAGNILQTGKPQIKNVAEKFKIDQKKYGTRIKGMIRHIIGKHKQETQDRMTPTHDDADDYATGEGSSEDDDNGKRYADNNNNGNAADDGHTPEKFEPVTLKRSSDGLWQIKPPPKKKPSPSTSDKIEPKPSPYTVTDAVRIIEKGLGKYGHRWHCWPRSSMHNYTKNVN